MSRTSLETIVIQINRNGELIDYSRTTPSLALEALLRVPGQYTAKHWVTGRRLSPQQVATMAAAEDSDGFTYAEPGVDEPTDYATMRGAQAGWAALAELKPQYRDSARPTLRAEAKSRATDCYPGLTDLQVAYVVGFLQAMENFSADQEPVMVSNHDPVEPTTEQLRVAAVAALDTAFTAVAAYHDALQAERAAGQDVEEAVVGAYQVRATLRGVRSAAARL